MFELGHTAFGPIKLILLDFVLPEVVDVMRRSGSAVPRTAAHELHRELGCLYALAPPCFLLYPGLLMAHRLCFTGLVGEGKLVSESLLLLDGDHSLWVDGW